MTKLCPSNILLAALFHIQRIPVMPFDAVTYITDWVESPSGTKHKVRMEDGKKTCLTECGKIIRGDWDPITERPNYGRCLHCFQGRSTF